MTGVDGGTSEFRTKRAEAALHLGYEVGTELDTRIGLRFGAGDVDLRTGSGSGGATGGFQIGSIDSRLMYDTLDSVRFPTEGSLARLNLGVSRSELGADNEYTKLDATAVHAFTLGTNTMIVGLGGGTALTGDLPTYDRLPIGGLFSLSGYSRDELSTENLVLGRLFYMRRLTERSPVFFDLPVYIGGSLETARLDSGSDGDTLDRTAVGSSVFLGADTPLGAGYLALGQGDGGRTAAYIYFGKLF